MILGVHDVKVIRVGSTFPIKNRMIYPWNIAYLNKNTIGQEEVKRALVRAVDRIMIHTTNKRA